MASPNKSMSSSEESLHFDESDNESPTREWSPFDPDKLRRQLAEQRQREAQALEALEQQFVTPPRRSPNYYYDGDETPDDSSLDEDSDDEQLQQAVEDILNRAEVVQEEGRQAVQGPPRRCVRRLSFSEFAPEQQQQESDFGDETSYESTIDLANEPPEEVHPFLQTYRAEEEEDEETFERRFRMPIANHDGFIPNPALTPRGKARDAARLMYIRAGEATAAWNETFEDLEWTPRAAAKVSFSDQEPRVYIYGPFDKHEEDQVKPMSAFKSCFYPFYALARCCCKPKVDPEDCEEGFVNYDPSNDDDDDEEDDGFKFYDSD